MRSVRRMRESVYGHVLRLPMSFFDRAITGQLVSRVTNDTEAVKTLYVQVLFVMLDSVIVLCGAIVAMLWLDWRLMLIVAALVPAVALIVCGYQRLSAPAGDAHARAAQRHQRADGRIASRGMAVLQASNAARALPRALRRHQRRALPRAPAASCAPTPGCCGRCWTSSTCC